MDFLTDDTGINAINVYEALEYILDIANNLRIQRKERKQIQDNSIHYILKECEYLVNIRLFYHDIEDGPYRIENEDEEPQSMKNDNMQCFSIAKRKRILSQNQEDLSQNSQQISDNNDSSQILSAQQILNIMNNKQGAGLFLTPIKDRSYVRSLIAKEKLKNISYQDVLNNSITYYGKDGLDKKATNLFNKYVKGHSLGPLKIDQQISPLRVLPKELQLPKNVAFQRCYPQDIIEQLENEVKIENLNIDTRKISLDISQLDYSKIKLPNQKTEAHLETLLHVPTYQSLFQQNIMKYENSQLTLPTTQITSSQPHISIQVSNLNQIQKKEDEINNNINNNNNNLSSMKQINVKQESYHIPQQYRQQVYSKFNNQQSSLYSISPMNQQNKVKRTLSNIKQNDKSLSYNEYSQTRNLKSTQIRSLERNEIPSFQNKSPIIYDFDNQFQKKYYIDQSFDHQHNNEIQHSLQTQQNQYHNNSIESNQVGLNSIMNEQENDEQIEMNDSSIIKQNLENIYKQQKVMRKELSQLILERKKQQKYNSQIKNNNDKSKIIMFEHRNYSNIKHRSNVSPLPSKLNNSSQQIKEVLNSSQNYSSNKIDYLYQPQILSQYNNNHIKQPSYLPPLKTQRLSYNM
ncbi:hypothetical protein TTHERM_00370790 (macronuclear) [Tetrahymena thermophila SB210]|uniref:Uncharacterized protein n=1 Tax=Tetrahymena thermophila (strain SB210) TaxID=312017 RepID=I7M0K0_TETTS|nr:hypothetical protein TTHERM_00370790 [Tetrahymena thermophila SB210]EAR89264.1 hypothetical protein TTHERM_00370790 [Tetrahymena thermophila SB210]|eukprot:XP_001009509.1 hypothetical protein TTHERM_00370790 [Tetrahymena thermophila SB210]